MSEVQNTRRVSIRKVPYDAIREQQKPDVEPEFRIKAKCDNCGFIISVTQKDFDNHKCGCYKCKGTSFSIHRPDTEKTHPDCKACKQLAKLKALLKEWDIE